jgi:hypothetical protein
MRRRPRIDANHGEIVEALETAGAVVQSLAAVGDGCPDLLVSRAGHMWLIEVKDGAKVPSKRAFTPDQVNWRSRWRGPVHVVTSCEEALAVLTMTTAAVVWESVSASTVDQQLRKGQR